MRLKWDERAKRLAKEHNMVDEIEASLSRATCNAMGLETETGERIRWSLEGDTITVQVSQGG